MTARLDQRFASLKRDGRAALVAYVVCFFVLHGNVAAQPAAAITELPTIGHSTDCGPVVGETNVLCRYIEPLYLSDALRYPVLLQQQGWVSRAPFRNADEGLLEDQALWFERSNGANCSEIISLRMIPPAPETNRGPAIFVYTNYAPICGAERQAP